MHLGIFLCLFVSTALTTRHRETNQPTTNHHLFVSTVFGNREVFGDDDGPVPVTPTHLHPSDEALIVTDYSYSDFELNNDRVHVDHHLVDSSFLKVPPVQLFVEATIDGGRRFQTCHATRWESKKGTRYLTAAHCLCFLVDRERLTYTNFETVRHVTIEQITHVPPSIYCKVPNPRHLGSLQWCTEPFSETKLKNDWLLLDCVPDNEEGLLPGKVMPTAAIQPGAPIVLTATHWQEPSEDEKKRMGASAKKVKKTFGTPQNNNYQWGLLDDKQSRDDRLQYTINTLKGFSGTGLYQQFEEEWRLVGMHQRDDLPNLKNTGMPLSLINQIERHEDEL
eukprot:TRINITY_DN66668_c4_g5_i2.p1 TRINITY_DN66668_c4_g5~~TRINITY_DN66668_c4_g5_i2.p1  ORF type:complete len:336 (+),score=31.60 TRINITY_DN66668_c4_g5_i2:9-1016(+)